MYVQATKITERMQNSCDKARSEFNGKHRTNERKTDRINKRMNEGGCKSGTIGLACDFLSVFTFFRRHGQLFSTYDRTMYKALYKALPHRLLADVYALGVLETRDSRGCPSWQDTLSALKRS